MQGLIAVAAATWWLLLAPFIDAAQQPFTAVMPTGDRTNYCQRALLVASNQLTIANAMRNTTLRIGVAYSATPSFAMTFSNVSGQPIDGYMYTLQQQLAALGGFRIQYVPFPNANGDTDAATCCTASMFQSVLKHVDVVANDVYNDSPTLRSSGLGFVSQVIDSSLILVTESITHAADLSYVAFLLPFSAELWIALAAVIVFNGLLDYALQRLSPYRYTTVDGPTPSVRSLDHDENHDAGDVCEKSATSSMFVSWYLFTRVDEFEEENWPGRWLNTGYSFLILIFNSTYVANLASAFLVGTSTTTRLLSIDDANSRGSRICAWQGSTAAATIRMRYPGVKLVEISGFDTKSQIPGTTLDKLHSAVSVLNGIMDGVCDGAVVRRSDWDVASQTTAVDGVCSLVNVGPVVQKLSGSWPYVVDYSNKCTSLVEATVSELLVGLKATGALQQLYSNALFKWGDADCQASASSTDFKALGFASLAGIFILWVAIATLAVLLHLFPWKRLGKGVASYSTTVYTENKTKTMRRLSSIRGLSLRGLRDSSKPRPLPTFSPVAPAPDTPQPRLALTPLNNNGSTTNITGGGGGGGYGGGTPHSPAGRVQRIPEEQEVKFSQKEDRLRNLEDRLRNF